MELNCIDNLHKCNAQCCKQLKFDFRHLTKNQIHYYETHGCKVSRMLDRSWVITVPMICPQLKDNKCSLHGTPEKPQICQDYGNQKTGILYPENCIY